MLQFVYKICHNPSFVILYIGPLNTLVIYGIISKCRYVAIDSTIKFRTFFNSNWYKRHRLRLQYVKVYKNIVVQAVTWSSSFLLWDGNSASRVGL